MLTSSEYFFPIFIVSILFQYSSAKPQYFSSPLHQTNEKYDMKEVGASDSTHETHPYYNNYPENEFLSNRWFAANALPTQESPNTFSLSEFSESLIPPVYGESQFNSVISELENQPFNTQSDLINEFERGRSDIEPEEEEEFLGYFYPKPKIPFNLPDFNPLSAASDVNVSTKEDTFNTTTTSTRVSTEKTTNVTVESSTGTSEKV